ncbi:metabolite-proton symporter [Paraburkholderia fungorum]|jgi:MHS family shikimate/dehydroshikimate transporter-like MFS transporter|uniref:MFS transporter n=1 Tax=Paraburkholderia fungorum TaxID=134537 RepID=UPI000D04AB98|nr:MFS transporter [Paraburkholderia fungorum]PRZ44960.1 metabolite-proton symporter [Paraburkholderia fungorum]
MDGVSRPISIAAVDQKSKFKVLISSVMGSVIEWYDYTVYGVAAALIFRDLFFPNFSQSAGTIAAFGSFAAGFIARPIGGMLAGHYGDRIGRKATLVVTLVTMGMATTAIGLLPTYSQAGLWAPILLILARLIQGFAVGGEWGGAVLMAVEHAPAGRRGLWGACPQVGVSTGLVLGTAAFAAVSMLPNEQFVAWGWRIPFFISIVLAFVGLYIRLQTEESPAFAQIKRTASHSRAPLLDVLRDSPKELALAIGTRFADGGNYYIFTVFILSYAAQHTSLSRNATLLCVMGSALLNILSIPFWGAVSDVLGRRPVFIGGSIFLAVSAYPFFLMVDSSSPALLFAGLSMVLCLGHGPVYGPLAAYYAELFPSRTRYSGVSLGYQAASILLGGLTPMIASSMTAWAGGKAWPVVIMIATSAVIAAVTMAVSPETSKRSLLEPH